MQETLLSPQPHVALSRGSLPRRKTQRAATWMLLAGVDFPPDVRVEKEAKALSHAGYAVTVICDSYGARPSEDHWEGCRVLRVRPPPRVLRKLTGISFECSFFNWYWYRVLAKLLLSEGAPSVLHVHDLPLLGTAVALRRRFKLGVIADLHENYPAALTYYWPRLKWWYGHPCHAQRLWEAYERWAVKTADHVLVVVEEARRRVGAGLRNVSVVENTPDLSTLGRIAPDREIIRKFRDDFVISYVGSFGVHRGADLAIDALPEVLARIPQARLLLVGRGPIKPSLQCRARRLGVSHRVTFVNWQPFEKALSYIAASSVCLVPHRNNPHTEATSPHKLFQYMFFAKPVVTSSCRPLKRVVQEASCGLVFEAGNRESLASAIVRLSDPQLRERLGQAGKKAVREKYNWERSSLHLLEAYKKVLE